MKIVVVGCTHAGTAAVVNLKELHPESEITIYEKNDNTYVVYKEKENDVETTTSIKIEGEKVTIKRFGEINSTMTFRENQTINSNYTTPQGMFVVETKTTKLNINMEEDIIINVDYNIEIMDMFKGRNVIKIYIGK